MINEKSSQIRMNKFENIKIIYSNANRTAFTGIQNKVIYLVVAVAVVVHMLFLLEQMRQRLKENEKTSV